MRNQRPRIAQREAVTSQDEMLVGAAKEVSDGQRPVISTPASSRRSSSHEPARRRSRVSSKAQPVIHLSWLVYWARREACPALGLSDLPLPASCSPTWR